MIRPFVLAGAILSILAGTSPLAEAQIGFGNRIGFGGGIQIGSNPNARLYTGHGYPSLANGYVGSAPYGLSYGYRGLGYGGIGLGVRRFGYPYNYPYYGGNYNAFHYYNNVYPYGFNGVYGPYSIYGPLTLPSNSLYGVGAAQSVMPQLSAPAPLDGPITTTIRVPAAGRGANGLQAGDGVQDLRPQVAARPAGDRVTAQQRLDAGDAEFKKQQYQSAYLEYQRAKQADPDWAEPYFRRGWALTAIGRYHLAAESFQEGFKRNADWTLSKFRLDDLYADNKLAKDAHLDALATQAKADPSNSDVWMILGLTLYFDGQPERSLPFFSRSAESAPVSDQGLLKSFLGAKQPTEDREI